MDAKQVAFFKKLLLSERERVLNNSKKTLESELHVSADDLPDETDIAAHESNQHLTFQLRDRERHLLSEINESLMRLEDGSYGVCEETEEPIEVERLKAVPWTRLSLIGAELRENRRKKFA